LAEREIRRLQSQIKSDRRKQLSGRPRSKLDDLQGNFALEDMDGTELQGSRRLCKTEQLRKSLQIQETEVLRVSTEKLLEASLHSLDVLTLRKSQGSKGNNLFFLSIFV
jgi:hypothetical protein